MKTRTFTQAPRGLEHPRRTGSSVEVELMETDPDDNQLPGLAAVYSEGQRI